MGYCSWHKINVSGPNIKAFRARLENTLQLDYSENSRGEMIIGSDRCITYLWLNNRPSNIGDLNGGCEAYAFPEGDGIEIRYNGRCYVWEHVKLLSQYFPDLKFEAIGKDDALPSVELVCFNNGLMDYHDDAQPGDPKWIDAMIQLGDDEECIAELIISGETLVRFIKWMDGKNLSLEKIAPIPYAMSKSRVLNDNACYLDKSKYEKNLLDWRIENWGTSADLWQDSVNTKNNQITVKFKTEWTPPKPAIKKLSQMFPDLYFGLVYRFWREEEWKVVMYLNGEVCHDVEVSISKRVQTI